MDAIKPSLRDLIVGIVLGYLHDSGMEFEVADHILDLLRTDPRVLLLEEQQRYDLLNEHDELLEALQEHVDFCPDIECETCIRHRALIRRVSKAEIA